MKAAHGAMRRKAAERNILHERITDEMIDAERQLKKKRPDMSFMPAWSAGTQRSKQDDP